MLVLLLTLIIQPNMCFIKSCRPLGVGVFSVTSQILDEILEFHLPLSLHVGTVHICVEEDDGEGQDEDGVRVLELPNQGRITYAVSLTAQETKGSNI